MNWINTDEKVPEHDEVVVGYWPAGLRLYLAFPLVESLRYQADQDGNGDGWKDAHGEESDPPAFWTRDVTPPVWPPQPRT